MSKGNRQDGLEREMSALPEGVGLQTCQIYFKVYSKGNRYLLSVLGVKQIWRSSIDDKRGSGGSVSNYSGCFHDNHTCIFFFRKRRTLCWIQANHWRSPSTYQCFPGLPSKVFGSCRMSQRDSWVGLAAGAPGSARGLCACSEMLRGWNKAKTDPMQRQLQQMRAEGRCLCSGASQVPLIFISNL